MPKHGRKEQRTIALTPDIDQFVTGKARESFRSYSQQVEMMLMVAKHEMEQVEESYTNTQFDHAALADSSLLSRVR